MVGWWSEAREQSFSGPTPTADMTRHEATYEITSRADKRAVRRLMDRTYDTLREELREVGGEADGRTDTLQEFDAIREAVEDRSHGTLTIVYESPEEIIDE